MRNAVRKILKENDLDWVDDVLKLEYFQATPEMLTVGTRIIVDGRELDDDGRTIDEWVMEPGIIISIEKFDNNDIILVKFDNWVSPDGHNIVINSAPMWQNKEEECSNDNCWSFVRDYRKYLNEVDIDIYILNPNYKEKLKEEVIRKELKMELPNSILRMNRIFKENGHELYVVGGAVRDLLVGNEPKDFDLATDATPDKVKSMLRMYRTIDMGEQFAIVNVVTEDGQYEIATFRKDIGKGRRPDSVEFTSIDQDVLRRDLTINALFYDIDKGEVVDLVGGIGDLEKNVVRTVGSASERFDEDKLRILRAFRFAARVGSELDEDIKNAIKIDKTPVSGNGLSLSQERIRDEFLKGIKQAQSVGYFTQLITNYNLWDWIFGRLVVTTEPLIETKDPIVLIAFLLRSNDSTLVERMLVNNLKYTTEEAREIAFLIKFYQSVSGSHYKLRERFDTIKMKDNTLKLFGQFMELSNKLIDSFLRYRITTSGDELMKLGFKGKEIGMEKDRIEKEKFQKIISKSKRKVAYSGIALTNKSKTEMMNYIFNNALTPELKKGLKKGDWEVLGHHMTINMGPLKEEYRPLLGQSFDLLVTHVGHTDKVLAVKVETQFTTKNKDPHITIAVNRKEGGKPVMANEIKSWVPVFPFEVEGKLEEITF